MYDLFIQIVQFVESLGYLGVFIMTFIESTFIPIPAEITLIPAGYLVQQGHMHGIFVLIISTLGTLAGSLTNYYIARHWGRKLFISKGKYFFMNSSKLEKMEQFFLNHGAISVFTGRFLPGIKHFISFPAGIARMNLRSFCLYTSAGGAIWCFVLIALGYIIGENESMIKKYLKQANFVFITIVIIMIVYYVWRKNLAKQKQTGK